MNLTEVVASRYWTAAGITMLHYLWIGALVGAFAAIVRAMVGALSANSRYAIALMCLAILTVAPAAIYVHVLPPTSLVDESVADSSESTDNTRAMSTLAGEPGSSDQAALLDSDGVNQSSQRKQAAKSLVTTMGRTLPWLWISGSPLMFALLFTGVVGSRRLCRENRSMAGTAIEWQCRRIADALLITRRVLIAVSDRVTTPVVIGVWRPVILLPLAVWTGCEPVQIEMILWHELAHVQRYDNLTNFVQRVIESLLFFQPAVWLVSRWVRLERENCCDAVALRHASSPQAYAETLASLAVPGLRLRIALANSASHQLVARMRCILQTEERTMPVSKRLSLSLAAISLALGCAMIAWTEQSQSSPKFISSPMNVTRVSNKAEQPTLSLLPLTANTVEPVQPLVDGNYFGSLDNPDTQSPTTTVLEFKTAPVERSATAEATATSDGNSPPSSSGNLETSILSEPAARPSGVLSSLPEQVAENRLVVTSSPAAAVDSGATRSVEPATTSRTKPMPGMRRFSELSEPIGPGSAASQEWTAAKNVSKLGGWYYLDDLRNVDEVNLAFYDTSEGRSHNERADTDEGLRTVSTFSHLRKLSLYRGQATDESMAALANLNELEVISCWNAHRLTDKGIQSLSALTNLREAYFDVGRLGDGALAVFGKLPKLEVVRMLIGNEVTDAGLQHLTGATQLRELAIGQGIHPITDAAVEHLLKLTSLENLNLQDSQISPAGIAKLKTLPRLQVLRVNASENYQRVEGNTWASANRADLPL